jgi:predicted site-specific integrase-resolvase
MPVTVNGQTYYRTAEACRISGISRNTLFRWLKDGFFTEPECRDWRGWRLFTEGQIQELKAKTGQVLEVPMSPAPGRAINE